MPFFFYILHLYLIHCLALVGVKIEPSDFLCWQGVFAELRPPETYGYGKLTVLGIWLLVCALLYGA